jgi:hypothetical protein
VADPTCADLIKAVLNLNDVLNEMWGCDDALKVAPILGAKQLGEIMDAQNKAHAIAINLRRSQEAERG